MILLELSGADASGKTTNLEYIYNKLVSEGKRVIKFKEVGNQHIVEMVELRKLILNKDSKINILALESMFLGMALQNIAWIRENKDNYDYMICDRGFACKYAYGKALVADLSEKERLCYEKMLEIHQHLRFPQISLYFRITPEEGQKRIALRNGGTDRIEEYGVNYQKKVIELYDDYFRDVANNSYVVNAMQPIENVQKYLDVVLQHISKNYA